MPRENTASVWMCIWHEMASAGPDQRRRGPSGRRTTMKREAHCPVPHVEPEDSMSPLEQRLVEAHFKKVQQTSGGWWGPWPPGPENGWRQNQGENIYKDSRFSVRDGGMRHRGDKGSHGQQLLTLLPGGLECVCVCVCACACVFNSKIAPTFHSPLSLPLLTSAALRFENSDTVVRATAAARPTHPHTARPSRRRASTEPRSVGTKRTGTR